MLLDGGRFLGGDESQRHIQQRKQETIALERPAVLAELKANITVEQLRLKWDKMEYDYTVYIRGF